MKETKIFGKAALAVLENFWASYTAFIAGWLISALSRHPEAEKAISQELVYRVILRWQGDIDFFGFTLVLILMFTVLSALQHWLQKNEYGQPGDGLHFGRFLVRHQLIPFLVAISAFLIGICGGDSWGRMLASLVYFAMMFVLATVLRYWVDTFDPRNKP
jgi:hypothetical protein